MSNSGLSVGSIDALDHLHPPKAVVSKAPSGRELAPKVTEGECDTIRFIQT